MSKKYLLLDCDYLCHRAKYTTGGLSYKETPTGVMYGFLRSLVGFQDLFDTSDFVFCWDSQTSKRQEIFPEYKAQRERKKYSNEELRFDIEFKKQMKKLRTTYLPMIGFKNVFVQKGYEGDDIIASICEVLSKYDEAVIISSDHDLFQCVSHNVSVFNPQSNKVLTLQGFVKQFGIEPIRWGLVKSFAGCLTDNVPGIKGVGEKTAIKFMKAELNPNSKVYKAITSPEGVAIRERNARLVILPFEGTNCFRLGKDSLSEQGWKQVTKLLGMQSIRDRMPFGGRRWANK